MRNENAVESLIITKENAQSSFLSRHLNNMLKSKNSVSIKSPGAHFTLKQSTNQNLEPYLYSTIFRT